jgi:hypothetical protein
MNRKLLFVALALLALAAPVSAAGITGHYIEARTCDVYTGACFANADTSLTGRHGVMAWKIEKGSVGSVHLDGLGVVAVVAASETLGQKQTGTSRAMLIVDKKANAAQRQALIQLAKQQGGDLLSNVVAIQSASIDLVLPPCKEGGCSRLDAGIVKVETRCIDHQHDKGCGSELDFYPPLSRSVKARPAVAVEHSFTGKGFNETWTDHDRRGAYVGSFELR